MTGDGLSATILDPGADALFVRLAYLAVLSREPEDGIVDRLCADLARGAVTRPEIVSAMAASPEFQEALVLERHAVEGILPSEGTAVAPATSERVVEIPWVLAHYRGDARVLDIGYANAPSRYLARLLRLGIPDLHAVDMATGPLPRAARTSADVRALPYRDGSFDLAVCISTLEHIGRDNSRYGLDDSRAGEDAAALAEVARVLRPGGRLLVTVPYGAAEHHGWFVQYDKEQWDALVEESPFSQGAREAFRMTGDGWVRERDESVLARCRYGDGVPGASSVLCAELVA